jgi:hypothetical protein
MKQKKLLAQLQVHGVDMNASGLSKLEGQLRYVTDFGLTALVETLFQSGRQPERYRSGSGKGNHTESD